MSCINNAEINAKLGLVHIKLFESACRGIAQKLAWHELTSSDVFYVVSNEDRLWSPP